MGSSISALKEIGLAKPLVPMVLFTDEPKIPGFLAYPSADAGAQFAVDGCFGQGFDRHKRQAQIKALAELYERMSLENPETECLIHEKESNLERVDPALFYHKADPSDRPELIDQLSMEKFVFWRAYDVVRDRDVLVPAQQVFLSDDFDNEMQIAEEAISTGAAVGIQGTGRAFRSGLLEVIERDACITAHLAGRPAERIVGFPGEINELLRYLGRYELQCHLFDVATDLEVPVVMCICLDESGIGPAVNVGSSSSLDYRSATFKAILESIQCRRVARILSEFDGPDVVKAENIHSMEERFAYWSPTERIADLSSWLAGGREIKYDTLGSRRLKVRDIVQRLRKLDYHLLVANISLKPMREQHVEALKVMIPELHPLYLDEDAKTFYSVHHGTLDEQNGLGPHPFT